MHGTQMNPDKVKDVKDVKDVIGFECATDLVLPRSMSGTEHDAPNPGDGQLLQLWPSLEL